MQNTGKRYLFFILFGFISVFTKYLTSVWFFQNYLDPNVQIVRNVLTTRHALISGVSIHVNLIPVVLTPTALCKITGQFALARMDLLETLSITVLKVR